MSVPGLAEYVQKRTSHHPLVTACLAIFLAVTLLLGFMHEIQIAAEVSIILVQRFKRQAEELNDVGARLKKELTTWGDAKKGHEPTAKPPAEARAVP